MHSECHSPLKSQKHKRLSKKSFSTKSESSQDEYSDKSKGMFTNAKDHFLASNKSRHQTFFNSVILLLITIQLSHFISLIRQ